MKRFYCTVCQRIKRVRKYPVVIQSHDSIDPTMRVGKCNRHNQIAHSITKYRELSKKVAR